MAKLKRKKERKGKLQKIINDWGGGYFRLKYLVGDLLFWLLLCFDFVKLEPKYCLVLLSFCTNNSLKIKNKIKILLTPTFDTLSTSLNITKNGGKFALSPNLGFIRLWIILRGCVNSVQSGKLRRV